MLGMADRAGPNRGRRREALCFGSSFDGQDEPANERLESEDVNR